MANRPLLEPFAGRSVTPPPIWLMRQAGRYLPEYRAVRAKAGSFLDLCYAPELACEVTLQPIRRFGFDAAIIFSDILVVPHALGQAVRFEEGEGPRLDPIGGSDGLGRLDPAGLGARLEPVYEAVRLTRERLPGETALIGFCGAPWTVASYMVAGQGTPDQAPARLWAYRDPAGFAALIDMLVKASIEHLARQVEAGCQVVQVFDSWAGSLPPEEFQSWVVEPTARIVAGLKARHEKVPVIGFPRGAGGRALAYARQTGVDGVSCDGTMDAATMARDLPAAGKVVQGRLDPLLLLVGGAAMRRRIDETLSAMAGRPFIFNLSHGILPQTPPEHVAELVAAVRAPEGR